MVVNEILSRNARMYGDETAIIEYCRDKMASFKRPKRVIFIEREEMPRTGSGKILHRVLRERFAET